MVNSHSFTEYIRQKFDNDFWKVAEEYLDANIDSIEINTNKIHKAGEHEISNVKVEHVWVEDLPKMDILFKVALSIDFVIQEGDYHYDNYDDKIIWIMVECKGNLDERLDDFKVIDFYEYNGKGLSKNALDDSLVPYISYDKLEQVAEDFLKEHYPEALKIPLLGQPAIWVDPIELAKRMNLTVKTQRIRKDASIFGQIYFEDTTVNMYDKETDSDIATEIEGKTIVVDPNTYLLRNLGCVNNTIVHECVHWDKHRKAFKLEQLFNESLSCISCQVVGGLETVITGKSTEFMEKQANQLAPRIQMPKEPFINKAKEYIVKFMRDTNASHEIDVMEKVINQLSIDFGVSVQAAKIRLVELGFTNAIGTFNYVDGHYVRAHSFKKDSIKISQTFTISDFDAAFQRLSNPKLLEKVKNGDYIYLENHYVYNAPLYVSKNNNGSLELTDYARAHMDECCLVFDLKITSKIETEYYTVCYLNRGNNYVTFEVKYNGDCENYPQSKQIAFRQKQMNEWIEIRKQMTDDPEQCMDLLLKWRGMDYTTLGAEVDLNPKTISRTVRHETSPKVETAVLICLGLNLPPIISEKVLDVLGCKLSPIDKKEQWYREVLNTKYSEPIEDIRKFLAIYEVTL